jgi:dolichyl-phosphate-mannose-protein mannosyltransferase
VGDDHAAQGRLSLGNKTAGYRVSGTEWIYLHPLSIRSLQSLTLGKIQLMNHKLSAGQSVTILAVLLLLMMGILAGGAARRESVTVDEVAHVGAGVSYLQKLDYRMNEEHPPLAKVLAAIPLVLRGVHADYSDVSWTVSAGFFKQYLGEWVFGHALVTQWNDPYATMFWARLPMLLLMLVLGWVLFSYGTKLGDAWGGLLCLAAYATMPAFLVFGPLVLTDLAVTMFSVLTLWTLAEMWRTPTRATIIKFGLALAGALLSKFSAGLLFVCFGAFILSLRLRPTADLPASKFERQAWRSKRFRSLAKGTLLAGAVVYVVYLVLSWNQPTDSFNVMKHFPASVALRRMLMPPWEYLRGLAGFALTASRPTYILGHSYPHGVWFYFPVVFLLKSPLAFIALLLLALAMFALGKARLKSEFACVPDGMELHWRALWIFLLIFTGACILSRLDLSIRHFSVPLALLILMLSLLPRMSGLLRRSGWRMAQPLAWTTVALALVLVFTAVRAYPDYFPFLNSLSLGRPGYALVNDSNLDWNQALPEVERIVQQRGLKHLLLDEYGISEPEVYVPQAQFWNCQEPAPSDAGQWAVVSAGMIEDGHNCLWLMQYPHETLAGGSMYGFRLPDPIPGPGSPDGPPLPANWHNFGGFPMREDARLVFLNCIRDPRQIQPTLDRLEAEFQAMAKERKK